MGLDIASIEFLLASHKKGATFGDVLMLGRQQLIVYPAKMRKALAAAGISSDLFSAQAMDTGFAEPLFKALGARSVQAMDVSSFEGAEIIHDLNKPVGNELKERFDVIYDGGTLEHIFNYPQALQNCMEMLRPGGLLFLDTPTNNWCGHGFYQLSPELFYTALSEENGFVVEQMIAHAVGPYNRWYAVSDPRKVRSRVEVITWYPLGLKIRARRTRVVPIFATPPQQSDYVPRWTDRAPSNPRPAEKPKVYLPSRPGLAKILPGVARFFDAVKTGWIFWRTMSLGNRKSFRPVKKE